MLRSDFSYELPNELIAQKPASERAGAKLFVDSSSLQTHTVFSDISRHIPPYSLVVYNDTKVINARLFGYIDGRRVEVFLLENPWVRDGNVLAYGFAKPGKKFDVGCCIKLNGGVDAEVVERPSCKNLNRFLFKFSCTLNSIYDWISRFGTVPLPPYIRRKRGEDQHLDHQRYQTVYAQNSGSVAAPTAGLHFTRELKESLESNSVIFAPVTLHVGGGTFSPVKVEDIAQHAMHSEAYYVPCETYKKIVNARKEEQRIIALGTTSFRCVEDLFVNKKVSGEWQRTKLFIYPKNRMDLYKSNVFDGILTNFHQPYSTLFMLICALLGWERAHNIYREAVAREYNFLSYGDSSLLWFN